MNNHPTATTYTKDYNGELFGKSTLEAINLYAGHRVPVARIDVELLYQIITDLNADTGEQYRHDDLVREARDIMLQAVLRMPLEMWPIDHPFMRSSSTPKT